MPGIVANPQCATIVGNISLEKVIGYAYLLNP
jgi:hypothetical protein